METVTHFSFIYLWGKPDEELSLTAGTVGGNDDDGDDGDMMMRMNFKVRLD